GASGSFFLLVGEDNGELKKIYSQGSFKKSKVLSKTQSKVAEECIKRKKVVTHKKNKKDQNAFSTIVASPIIANDQCIGVLGLQFNQTERIAKSVFEYIQVLSDHAAQSIDRVRAFKQTEEAKKKADLANRAKSTFLANM